MLNIISLFFLLCNGLRMFSVFQCAFRTANNGLFHRLFSRSFSNLFKTLTNYSADLAKKEISKKILSFADFSLAKAPEKKYNAMECK